MNLCSPWLKLKDISYIISRLIKNIYVICEAEWLPLNGDEIMPRGHGSTEGRGAPWMSTSEQLGPPG